MIAKPLHLDMNEQIECAQTLASRFYTDLAILDFEKLRLRKLRRYSQKQQSMVW
jgi:hypothetical protein